MQTSIALAWRYLWGHKTRTFLTTLAIFFGVMVVYGLNAIMPAMLSAFRANAMAASGKVDLEISHINGDVFDVSALDKLKSVPELSTVSPVLVRSMALPADMADHDPNTPDTLTSVNLVGVDPALDSALHAYQPKEGRFLTTDDTRAVVLSQHFSEATGYKLGDQFPLTTPSGLQQYKIVGIISDRITLGNEEFHLPLAQMQSDFQVPGKVNLLEANFIAIPEGERAAVMDKVQSVLGESFKIGGLGSGEGVLANLQLGTAIMSFLGVLALLMGGFIIFNTFRTILAERKRDIGMLRAIGAEKSTISQMILWEGLMQGLLGSLAGILVGWILGGVLVKGMQGLFSQYVNIHIAPPGFSPSLAGLSLALGLGVTLLAGLLPARSAMRITPMDALRPSLGKVSITGLLKPGFWIGLGMLVLAVAALLTQSTTWLGAGAVLLVTGLVLATPMLIYPLATALGWVASRLFPKSASADLARNNLVRQPSRTATTASATMIGFAILVAAVSVIQSATIGFTNVLRKSLGSDLILMPASIALWGTDIGASPQFAESIRAIPSVKSVSSLRFAPVTINGSTVSVLGIDPVDFQQVSGLGFTKGDEAAAYAALGDSRSAIINPLLASSINKKVGESMILPTPTGPQEYRIVGLASDFLNAKIATIYVSMQSIEQDFNKNEDVLLQIGLTDPTKKAEAETQIKSLMVAYPQFRLLVGADYINENISLLKAATAGLFLMLVFLAFPSLLAMLNSMAVAVIERTREIGMLRAVGATRAQVRSTITHEGIILALIGSILGIAAGVYLGYVGSMAMRALGYPMEYVFPLGTVAAALVTGLVFGLLSSGLPSRQAARMNVVEALRYE